jgi:hypothetical protein
MDRLAYHLVRMQKIILDIWEITLWRKSIQINYTRKRRDINQEAVKLEGEQENRKGN